jgi:hypothetical protein
MLLGRQSEKHMEDESDGIGYVLFRLKKHYLSCVDLIKYNAYGNINRAANRFIKVERAMINEMSKIFNIDQSKSINLEQENVIIDNYGDMHESNLQLIMVLKETMRKFNNREVSAFLSYWVAALQVENDELAKHL